MVWFGSSFFFFSSRRRHTRCSRDWSSDVCSSDLDLTAERARAVGASARHPARPGCGGVGATAERGGVVRAPARLHPIPRPLAMLDLKIEGAQVIDGTGAPGSRADVGIRDDVIVAVGDLSGESAGSSLWAAGRALAPGVIDMHSHSDWRALGKPRAQAEIPPGGAAGGVRRAHS